VRRAADAFNVSYARHQEPGAPADVYTVDHSTGMYLVDPDGRLVARLGYGTPVAELVARIDRWLDAAAN
jgi:protein SCO1